MKGRILKEGVFLELAAIEDSISLEHHIIKAGFSVKCVLPEVDIIVEGRVHKVSGAVESRTP